MAKLNHMAGTAICLATVLERGWNFMGNGDFHVHVELVSEISDIFRRTREFLGPQAGAVRIRSVLPAVNVEIDEGPLGNMICVRGRADYHFAA